MLRETRDNATSKLMESQTKWTNFAKDILTIGKELLKAVHALQANNSIPQEFLQMSSDRIQKYDAFLNESCNGFNIAQQVANEQLEDQNQGQLQSQEYEVKAILGYNLDYHRIKTYLKTCKDDEKICLMLQSLRITLLKIHIPKRVTIIIQSFISHDLLDCINPAGDLLKRLLKHHNKK